MQMRVLGMIFLTLVLVGCGDDGDGGPRPTPTVAAMPTPTATPTIAIPVGPFSDLSEEITAVGSPFIAAASGGNWQAAGYVEHEYIATGTASSYKTTAPLTADGRWTFAEDGSAPYRTRILVRRPANLAAFSGTVVVEWLNVSGGLDANPDYASLEEEILRRGHVWVGVSAQLIGVSGGPVLVTAPGGELFAGKGLKVINASRYGSLSHPGDGFSFDIFTQVARAIWRGGDVLGGAHPRDVIAAGESQSAIAMVTYYNGVQPLTKAFSGFFVHSRASIGLPLVGPGEYADLAGGFGTVSAIFRTDLTAPIIEVQAESDVTGLLNSAAARQPDSETFRLWEVAGTAHVDRHLLGFIADAVDCGKPINNGPMHVVAKAAFRGLVDWIRGSESPAEAARLELTARSPFAVIRDSDGIARGGVRTPPVDVPVEVLSGVAGPNPGLICLLLGSTTPLSSERLAALYPSAQDYEARYAAAADATIEGGFALAEDREALLEFADSTGL